MQDYPAYHCRFTTSEAMPPSKNLGLMQIKPGMECSVTLAGFPAFKGKVHTRQAYLDANRHHVEIQCASNLEVATSSVIKKTMEWRDSTFPQVAQDVLSKIAGGIPLRFEGAAPPQYKFRRISAMHGQPAIEFLDRICRSLSLSTGSGIAFTSDVDGAFVVAMAPLSGSDVIEEGKNAIILRETIYNVAMAKGNPVIAQGEGDNTMTPAKWTHMPFFNGKQENQFDPSSSPMVIINELPTSDIAQLQGRAGSEGKWKHDDQITVTATVYGWLRPTTGGLWKRNTGVTIISPSMMMDGSEQLKIKSATFTQDDRTGTRTTLICCNDAALSPAPPIR